MLDSIDNFLDKITMYRLVLYYLIVLLAAAAGLSTLGQLTYSPVAIVASSLYLVAVCWLTNKIFAHVYKIPANIESPLITALILSLIITPLSSMHNLVFLSIAGVLAIASKYILAIKRKHIFNPAAIAVVLTAFGLQYSASWWVGSAPLLPFVIVGGVLVVRKIRRGVMIFSFFAAAITSTIIVNLLTHGNVMFALKHTLLHSSLFFLAFVMLSEPVTSPPTQVKRTWYGVIAGLIFPPQIHIAGIYSTPELALVISNIYSYIVSPKAKLVPKLAKKISTGPASADFIFNPMQKLDYEPGQYMEWTLGHDNPDSRGNRRYFTLASSPTEKDLRIGVKFYPNGSTYKKAMLSMNEHTPVVAGQLSGDFVLPKDTSQKLVFIAGGIGITPYRSMIKYLIDKNEPRDAVLLYSETKKENLAYTELFDQAKKHIGLKPVYTLTDLDSLPHSWIGKTGFVSGEMIKSEIPDYNQRLFYISGPHPMVKALQESLAGIGVPNNQIKIDFFPGYA